MAERPPPPVTIEGGPGWQLDVVDGETLGEDAPPRPLPRPPRWLAVPVVSALVGAVVTAAVLDWRTDRLGEGDAGLLSLEATGVDDVRYYDLVEDERGRLSTVPVLAVRNTGPRDVELREVSLPGTEFAAEGVEGLRIRASSSVRVVLVRAVDCDRPRADTVPTGLHVRALTEAGERERRLPVSLGSFAVSDDASQAACGRLGPGALQVLEQEVAYEDGRLRMDVELRNPSAEEVVVRAVRTAAPGLAVELLEPDGTPLQLPVTLPGGDFSEPREIDDPALPTRRLTVVVSVADCEALADRRLPGAGGPLLELDLDGPTAGSIGFVGDLLSNVRRLRSTACP